MQFTRGIPFFRLVLCLIAVVAVAVLLRVPTPTVRAAFPGSNGQISFGLFNPNIGDTQVWVSNPDGSSPILLTPQSGSEISDWSADGSKVALDFFDGQTSQIGTINPDASGFVQLTTQENVQRATSVVSRRETYCCLLRRGKFPGRSWYLHH